MDKDNERLIEFITKQLERSQSWIEDAEAREDWGDVYFYQGEKAAFNRLIVMLGGKWID